MQVAEIEPGLWRWTAHHPAWTKSDGGPDGWSAEVACVYWEAPEAVVLIDPLVPAEAPERKRFWRALDRDVGRHGRPVVVLLTCPWHRRSTDEMVSRYDATVTAPSEPLPGDAAAYAIGPGAEEVVYWLPAPRTLVVGDVLVGTGNGSPRLCPESWLPDGLRHEQVRNALEPLLALPVERVLPSHGEPVVADGRNALAGGVAA